jgi:hypothetical protein
MSWEDQGRQYHGWFGHGMAPGGDDPSSDGVGAMFDPGNFAARIDAMAYSAVAHMPNADRHRDSATFDRQRLERLRKIMTTWTGARSLSQTAFKERFVDPSTSGAAIEKLRAAAAAAKAATTHQDLADASADLAGAMRTIGLEKWPRFLSDAAERADANGPDDKTIMLAQLTTPNKATDASSTSGADAQKNQELADFQKRFNAATAAAYQKFSHDCSGYLKNFMNTMGYPMVFGDANDFMRIVQQKDSGWKQVTTAEEAVRLSPAGHIVTVGLAQPGGNGHVEVVGPRMIRATVPGDHPMSPQVFSGSNSINWDNARSQGEHTVADGWTRAEAKRVTYWVKQ